MQGFTEHGQLRFRKHGMFLDGPIDYVDAGDPDCNKLDQAVNVNSMGAVVIPWQHEG